MRDRNFGEKPTNTLRRSPRFIHENQTRVENPGTQKPKPRKIRATDAFSSTESQTQKNGGGISRSGRRKGDESKRLTKSSRGSAKLYSGANFRSLELQKQYLTEKRVTNTAVLGSRFVYNQDNDCDEISGKGDSEVKAVKTLEQPGKGSRRSVANVSKNDEILNSQSQYVIEKRVTRSSVRRNKFGNDEVHESGSEGDCGERLRGFSKEGKTRVGVEHCKQGIGITEKRVTRSSTQRKINLLVEKASNVPANSLDKVAVSDERKPKGDSGLSKPYVNQRDVKEFGIKRGSGDKNCKRNMDIGEKRKRHQIEEECEIVQGWTTEQELALQRAYFSAKPTPHFWKKVARMVPGKSAEECFDRIHSDLLTPSQPRTRSRANRKKPSPLPFSASKLLSPAETKTKKLRSGRRKTLVSQKTVRQLLQKQQNEDQDYEADLFAVLEPSMGPCSLNFQEGAFASPTAKHGSSILTRCREMSSSAHKKQLSRLHNSQKAAFVSPPVLKQIKNKAMHEKYIDQLHCRDAKRKAESLKKAKYIQDQNDRKASNLKTNSIKVAKDALVFNALDAINQLRSLQSITNKNSDDDDNDCCSDGEEDEDELC